MATPGVESFEIIGADGLPIRGNVHTGARHGEQRPPVVICHGFKGFKDWGFFPPLADRLAAAGFTAVRFNFSGAGVSDGDRFDQPERFGHDTFSRQRADLRAVLEWVGADGVGLVAHSRGGAAAVLEAASDARVRALVTWAAIARTNRWDEETVQRWRADGRLDIVNQRTGEVLPLYTDVLDDLERRGDDLNLELAAARVTAPWLIVHGTEDEAVSPEEARCLADSAPRASTELLLVEDAGHTFGARHPWAGSTPALDRVTDATVGWFARHLIS